MTPVETDEQLLAEFLAGRQAALGTLAQRYERPLLGLACGLLNGRRDLAADIVQESWLRVIRFGRKFKRRSSFKTWLYRIAVNQCRNLLKARALPEGLTGAETVSPANGPEGATAADDENHALRRTVARLDADKRAVILLCYHASLTHAEAAEILELPLGTLKSRLHAALEELRAALPAEGTP